MVNIRTGLTFVQNEQITHTKLHKIVNDATISSDFDLLQEFLN